MIGPKEKRERALGEPLQLKAERSLSPKAALNRRPFGPGQHGNRRKRPPSDFAKQLAEKQKFKLSYGLSERGLRMLFDRATRSPRDVSQELIALLERRLDNVLFRAGIVGARGVGRKIVLDGHITVNGRRTRSPGYQVGVGDVVAVYEGSRQRAFALELPKQLESHTAPTWITLTPSDRSATIASLPADIEPPFQVALVIESFSK